MRQQIENVRDGLKAADRTLVHCREIIAAYRKAIDDAGMRVYYLPKGGGMALCKKEEEETPPMTRYLLPLFLLAEAAR